MEYNKGKTVVNIEISQLFKDGLPGITICPAGLDMEKMATINAKYKKLHREYAERFNNSTEDYFYLNYHLIIQDDINQGILSFDDIFNNYTYDYEEELRMDKINWTIEIAADNDDGFIKVKLP